MLVEGPEATVVRATRPTGDGNLGNGISVQADPETGVGGRLWLTASLLEGNHDASALIAGGEATIVSTVVRATKRAPAGLEFDDGILVLGDLDPTSATIAATESTDNARAGVLYVGGTGELSGVRSSGNRFGLVLQPGMSGAQPALLEGNAFEDNTERDMVQGGDLPVPDTALSLP